MTAVCTTVDVEMDPESAFDVVVEELIAGLARLDIQLDPRKDGRVVEGDFEVGRIIAWDACQRVLLEWHPADWAPDQMTEVELRVEPAEGGSRVTIEHRGWGSLLGDQGAELVAWFVGEMAAPFLRATAPIRCGDWLTDRMVRRPSGDQSRAVYRDPIYHRPNFRAMLDALSLSAGDYLVEVGCGGGAFLQEALRSGCRAGAVDHSPDMVALAREVNLAALAEGRLEILESDADRLPFGDATFTCAAMTGVLPFLRDPVAALSEIRRVLVPGGRLVLFTGAPDLKGTPAAPEPMARRLFFYRDEDLERLAVDAGFANVRVERPDLLQFAREAGVPEEHLPLFSSRSGQLLLAST